MRRAADRQSSRLDQLALGGTLQSRRGVDAVLGLSAVTLHGRAVRCLVIPGAALLLARAAYGVWFFRRHARALAADLQDKLQKDLPIVAYQQLSLEPHRDREKSAILHAIASRYADAELTLEAVAHDAGVNRNKVNEVLKAELGFTFTGYLNKLRLTGAARLLAERGAAGVSEIAFAVGYNNVSYFNKLFKQEYDCTPKAFRTALVSPPGTGAAADIPAKIAATIRMPRESARQAPG